MSGAQAKGISDSQCKHRDRRGHLPAPALAILSCTRYPRPRPRYSVLCFRRSTFVTLFSCLLFHRDQLALRTPWLGFVTMNYPTQSDGGDRYPIRIPELSPSPDFAQMEAQLFRMCNIVLGVCQMLKITARTGVATGSSATTNDQRVVY